MGGQAVPGDGVGKGHQHPAVDGAVLLLVALSDHHDPLGGILFHADQMNAVLHRPGVQPPEIMTISSARSMIRS